MSLPAPAIEALEQTRLFAEHAGELAELEGLDWRFGLTDAGVFIAERPDDHQAGRHYDSDLTRLIRDVQRCQPRQSRKPRGHSKGAPTDA